MIDVGEETGDLDKMLLKVADNYDNDVDVLVSSLISILEPVMVVVLGLIVGFIVIALVHADDHADPGHVEHPGEEVTTLLAARKGGRRDEDRAGAHRSVDLINRRSAPDSRRRKPRRCESEERGPPPGAIRCGRERFRDPCRDPA